MATRKNRPASAPTEQDAEHLRREIHTLGDYAHVGVRAERGHLLICPDDEPVARLTPLGNEQYGLSFHSHTGRWEPMPFAGDLPQQARNIVSALGMYLERSLSDSNSGSDH
ncbi:MAG TPA: hypothetical protein VJ206_03495 [bacterium]|nr:hypothetical protein [bacterium]